MLHRERGVRTRGFRNGCAPGPEAALAGADRVGPGAQMADPLFHDHDKRRTTFRRGRFVLVQWRVAGVVLVRAVRGMQLKTILDDASRTEDTPTVRLHGCIGLSLREVSRGFVWCACRRGDVKT